MSYVLGNKSLSELEGVDPGLVATVHRAIQITPVDFSVHDGIRTLEEQQEYVDTGVSETLQSKHLDGLAVDLVPYINGKLRWELDPIYQIAEAVRESARKVGVRIRWGGCWEELTNNNAYPRVLVDEYILMRQSMGKRPFVDGPHFELIK